MRRSPSAARSIASDEPYRRPDTASAARLDPASAVCRAPASNICLTSASSPQSLAPTRSVHAPCARHIGCTTGRHEASPSSGLDVARTGSGLGVAGRATDHRDVNPTSGRIRVLVPTARGESAARGRGAAQEHASMAQSLFLARREGRLFGDGGDHRRRIESIGRRRLSPSECVQEHRLRSRGQSLGAGLSGLSGGDRLARRTAVHARTRRRRSQGRVALQHDVTQIAWLRGLSRSALSRLPQAHLLRNWHRLSRRGSR